MPAEQNQAGETACRGCLHWLAAAIAAAWCALAAGAAGAAQTPPDAPQRERAITALHQLQGAAVPGKSPVVAAYQARTVHALRANSARWSDPRGDGDAGLAPDVTSVSVSNTDGGLLTINIEMPQERYLLEGTTVFVNFDTDQNPGTGSTL